MHTHVYGTKDYGEVRIHANGDWSGEAIVGWKEPETKKHMEAKIPASLLLEISKPAALDMVRDRVISTLEQM